CAGSLPVLLDCRLRAGSLQSADHAALLLLGSSNLSSYFSSKVDLGTLDALTHFKADERYDFSTGLLGQITDLDVRILDEGLLDQAGFRQELVDTAFDHVFNDIFWLA